MLRTVHAAAAALVATLALTGAANALDIKAGSPGKLVPTKVQLGIIPPVGNACPGNGKLTAWVQTNRPGKIDILIVRKNGAVAGPYAVTTVKGANGVTLGSYSQVLNVAQPINAEYRVVIAGTGMVSNWVPLVASC